MPFFRKKEKEKTWKRKNPRMYSGVPKRGKQGRKNKFLHFLFWVLLLVFAGVSAYLFLFSSFMEVETISVSGNKDISSEEIESRVREAISGKYYGYFSRNNFFLVNRKAIDAVLKNNFSRLEVASIEKKFPKAILIEVKERQPELVWCSGGVCYLIDGDGLAYSGASGTDEELRNQSFLTVVDENARPVEIGKTNIGSEYVDFLKKINLLLRDNLHLETEGSYSTPALASREVTVKIKEGWFLKLSESVSSEETEKIIQTVFEKELSQEKRQGLDYLDLRIKNKVYYKMR
jgi:cell division septal protein FtsQ